MANFFIINLGSLEVYPEEHIVEYKYNYLYKNECFCKFSSDLALC